MSRRKEKCNLGRFTIFNQSLLSPKFSPIVKVKKRKRGLFGVLAIYGCFLVTSNATRAMPMMKTMIIAATAYMTVVFEAKPLTGAVVVVVVASGELAQKYDVASDP